MIEAQHQLALHTTGRFISSKKSHLQRFFGEAHQSIPCEDHVHLYHSTKTPLQHDTLNMLDNATTRSSELQKAKQLINDLELTNFVSRCSSCLLLWPVLNASHMYGQRARLRMWSAQDVCVAKRMLHRSRSESRMSFIQFD